MDDDIVEVDGPGQSQPKGLKRRKSPAWTYFTIQDVSNPDMVTCDLCDQKVKTKQSSTTNLLTHLSTKHPEQYALMGGACSVKKSRSTPEQHTLKSILEKHQKYSDNSQRHQFLTGLVRDYLATGKK